MVCKFGGGGGGGGGGRNTHVTPRKYYVAICSDAFQVYRHFPR